MRYSNLKGQVAECEVVAPGPKSGTVWGMRPDGSYVVVKAGTKKVNGKPTQIREEVDYQAPAHIAPLPAAAQESAEEVIDRYKQVMNELSDLGKLTPVGDDYKAARVILDHQEKAQKSRQPFLAGRGGNAAVGDRKLKELSQED